MSVRFQTHHRSTLLSLLIDCHHIALSFCYWSYHICPVSSDLYKSLQSGSQVSLPTHLQLPFTGKISSQTQSLIDYPMPQVWYLSMLFSLSGYILFVFMLQHHNFTHHVQVSASDFINLALLVSRYPPESRRRYQKEDSMIQLEVN